MFSKRLKVLRKEKGYTQAELAKCINSSLSKIAMWETEKRDPVKEDLLVLSELFDVSIDYLLGKTDNRNIDTEKNNDINKEKDFEEEFEKLINSNEKMKFCGKPLDDEDMKFLRDSLRATLEYAKTIKNKK